MESIPGRFVVHPEVARAGLEWSGHADSTRSCVKGLRSREVIMSTSFLYHAFGIRGVSDRLNHAYSACWLGHSSAERLSKSDSALASKAGDRVTCPRP